MMKRVQETLGEYVKCEFASAENAEIAEVFLILFFFNLTLCPQRSLR